MIFAALKTASFRNLADGETETRGRDIFLVGENGQGKTNFLEALYFSAYGSSFRGSRDGELVKNGESASLVEARFDDPMYECIKVKIAGGKKHIELDGKSIEDRKELLTVIPCIIFCHEDMEFVSGPPESRRRFFDQTQSLCDPLYLDDLRRYRRVLKARNIFLRQAGAFQKPDDGVLESLDVQLVEYGLSIMRKREEAAGQFSAFFGPLYGEVSGIDGIRIRYLPSWKEAGFEAIMRRIAEKREQEKIQGLTLSGPHRDRYLFVRGESDFSATASTGQRRLLALLLRSAQASRFSAMTAKNPVLLLDDVLLELDPEKRRRFLALMPSYDQAFYTFLPEEPYERYRRDDTVVYEVRNGALQKSQAENR
ncbi:MAG: DNA replication and repair protein RecF [Spirochaetaceae bacterium]|jgi:DNA replication and repair protein RecF|nr:DNA replication and repair protein RecF [Spirochaetaceae bacterium]